VNLGTIVPGDLHGDHGVVRAGKWASASRTHVGKVRPFNEDRVLEETAIGLWAVADGMGGHCAGDLAAEAVIDSLRRLAHAQGILDQRRILEALAGANRVIHDEAREAGRISGSTVVGLHAEATSVLVFWAGDSRAYRWRRGMIERLTRDHSVVQQLIDAVAITPEAADRHPQSHVLTRALGAEATIVVDCRRVDLEPGDLFLLCSDGLVRGSLDPDLVYLANRPIGGIVDQLLLDALDAGGRDNISLVLVEYSG
jgi:serine/threonine protein phosphatase PrpC